MALYRNISMAFWTDAKVVDEFSPEDRYFYLYLLTNPHTNLCGCYEVSMKQMSDETGYTKEIVERLVARMEAHNVIRYSTQTKEVLVINWFRYNWTNSPKFKKAVQAVIEFVKDKDFKAYLVERLEGGEDTVSIPYPYRSDTSVSVSVSDTVSVNCISKPENKDKPSKEKPEKVKHKYGEYMNVLLTDEEYDKLDKEFPDLSARIDRLSSYIASKGVAYKSHYATIRNWARMDRERAGGSGNKVAQQLDDSYGMMKAWAEGGAEDADYEGL